MINNKLFKSPNILWEESSSSFLKENSFPHIPGAWQLMLLGDGSPTRHLQLLSKKETKIQLIGMISDKKYREEGPKEITQLKEPLIRRQVWIKNSDITLAWAESWWNIDAVNINLTDQKEPIWKNLTKDRSELFREVDTISIVNARWLQQEFKFQGPFWSRNYRFFRNKKPLTIIREVFNPYLEKWLGESGIKSYIKLCSNSS